MRKLLLSFALLYSIVATSMAAPPDLTAGGVPNEDPAVTINLGPTGARGWVYHVKIDASDSRQILVTAVDSGSPAAGILAIDDVILGADGTGANPTAFSSDARKSLALAIADAEAREPATLKLLRWRAGVTSTVTLTLQTMGAYSATAPYNCPKSTKILEDGLKYVYDHESAGRYSFGAITLLANGNSAYQAKARSYARGLIPSQYTMDKMMSDQRDASSMITWQRGHTMIFLAEYYLATGDSQVLPAVEAYAVNIAKNTSLFGTVGHIYAEKNADGSANGPMGGVYGVVNTPGLFCFLGILLAKECGLDNPEIDPAIERASRFFSYYYGKGAIPYGEHEPFSQQHENNGKCGLTALAFMLQDNRVEEGKFFAKMSTASANERELGHTGAFFNYVWAPLGAAVGGEEAAAAHFSRISWMLDLNRCWNGRFQYDCLNGEGPKNGSNYNGFQMSTAALLTYALPLRNLYITGKGHDSSRWLSSGDVVEAVSANNYNADSRSDSELIADLGNWSPKVRKQAADELRTRSISTSELSQITAIANNTAVPSGSRAGACYALGRISKSSSASVLAALLTDSDYYVRYMAAEAMRYLPSSARLAQLDTILTAADTTSQPLYPMVDQDPLHFAHGKLAMLLFYHGSAYGPKGIIWGTGINGVDRDLLYPAIRAVAETPVGLCRSTLAKTYENLTYDDMLVLSGSIVDSIINRSPSDKMFSGGVREGGVKVLHKFGIAEGVPACMIYAADEVGGRRRTPLGLLGTFGGGVHTVTPDPGAVPFLESYLRDSETAATAQTSLDQIAADTNPTPLMPLKSIQSVTAEPATITLPDTSTVLSVTSYDHAQGDSIYTWRKVSGPGDVTFTPNGTAAAATSAVQFDRTLGTYRFEVTMSDSRGLTEVSETVTMQLTCDIEGDFNADCKVDSSDLKILAEHWLDFSINFNFSGYWPLDESFGNIAADMSVNANEGTVNGGAEWKPSEGVNGALSFDGDDYVMADGVCGNIAASDLTLSLWIKSDSIASQQFVAAFNTVSGGNKLLLGHPSNMSNLYVHDGDWEDTGVAVFDGNWRHLVFVLNDAVDRVLVYVDGSNVYEYSTSTSIAADDLFSLGQEYDDGPAASDFYNGLIDEVRVYDRVLTLQEIQLLYNGSSGNPNHEGVDIFDLNDFVDLAKHWLMQR